MPVAAANGIEICYEPFGSPDDEPLLLIMGLSCQMLFWPERFCEQLAQQGFHVVRFDNRDVGLSTAFDDAPVPNVFAGLAGDDSTAAYRLADMAADAVGLLDALGIGAAHIVGQSMGGMIAQTVAIENRDRVRSLTSISSTTGDRAVGYAHPEALTAILGSPSANRTDAIEKSAALWRALSSPGFAFDEAMVRDRAGRCYDRRHNPMGTARQLMAIICSPDRTEQLRRLDVPAAVVHGDADPLVDVSGGEATAKAIPGADLLIVPGMGHDLPEPLWPKIIDVICGVARRARSAA